MGFTLKKKEKLFPIHERVRKLSFFYTHKGTHVKDNPFVYCLPLETKFFSKVFIKGLSGRNDSSVLFLPFKTSLPFVTDDSQERLCRQSRVGYKPSRKDRTSYL